ncbi:hypothetical protein Tco_1167302 [Tanacetum coccineum]
MFLGSFTFRLRRRVLEHSSHTQLEYDFEECYKALLEKLDWELDWENPKGGDYPFDLSKPLPLITHGKRQRVPFEFFINNDLKYLQGGISTMTYTTSTTKTKAAKYDLPGIEDMVPNIWSPVKVAYDKYTLWGISHWREQRKSFYAFARGMQSRGDVYLTKRILAVTHVLVMRKHGYGYLEEIIVRRANNALYRFKEGDFPRLQINDIEDMLILVLVEDLQLGVESYQKKINITKPDTTRPDLIKRHPYTPYKDLQGFIYVEEYKRNRLMRSDELYKFSDGTLTRLLSSVEDITKNIDMEYLPKRRWSTLEKKRAHFMIKDINKLKERRMMRSLEKFVGERFDTPAGNLVKKILLKLNLSDHRSILTDSKGYLKMVMERQSVKVKEIQERCIIKAFQDYQIKKVRWLPLIANSFSVSGMVIAEPEVGVTTRQLSGVEVDCFFVRMELFYFIDEVFDSKYIQVQYVLLCGLYSVFLFAANVQLLHKILVAAMAGQGVYTDAAMAVFVLRCYLLKYDKHRQVHTIPGGEDGFLFGIRDNGKILYVSIVGDDDIIAVVVDESCWVNLTLIMAGQHIVVVKSLNELINLEAFDIAQKGRGVLADGDWIEDPEKIIIPGLYGELDGVVSPSDELDTSKLIKLVEIGPSGELDGAPTLPEGRDTTKTVKQT